MVEFPIIWNLPVKDMNCRTTSTDDFFIVVKVSIEPATLLGGADNRRMVHQYATDSPKQHSSILEFRVFPSPRLVTLL